jgi:hypothetical protein
VNVDSVDSIKFLKLPNLNEITKAADPVAFRELADGAIASPSAPELYQIAQRDNGYPILEFAPVPDGPYLISYEIYKAAKKLTLETEFVPKSDVIKAGCATVGANTNFGDFEV